MSFIGSLHLDSLVPKMTRIVGDIPASAQAPKLALALEPALARC